MTQQERVLAMLRSAGKAGVRSDAFLSARIPRAAARVLELRQAGYEITAERERQFCRYVLQESAGVGAEIGAEEPHSRTRLSVNPGAATPGEPPTLFDQELAA